MFPVAGKSPSSRPFRSFESMAGSMIRSFSRRKLAVPYSCLLRVLLPSFLHTGSKKAVRFRSSTNNTSWLDGLRGLSAIAVINFHFLFAFSDLPHIGFGADAQHRSVLRLPVIRLWFEGFTAVAVFFIVSGYVCSLQALRYMNNNEHEKLLRSLCRSAFRRGLRLLMPTVCMTLITTFACYLGAFEALRPMIEQKKIYFPGAWSEPVLERFPTLIGQLSFWWKEVSSLINIWNTSPQYLHHDPHLWTIAYELRSSLIVYMVLLGVALCKPRVRMSIIVGMAVINFFWRRWEMPLFLGGTAIALASIRNDAQSIRQAEPRLTPRQKRLLRLLGYCASLYLMSYPLSNVKHPAPGFAWLNGMKPSWYQKDKFQKSVGSLGFIYLLATSEHKADSSNPSPLHRIFSSAPAQYMGQIMFAFYLVHGFILHSVGYAIPHLVWGLVGQDGSMVYGLGLFIGLLFSFGATLWVADVYTREIDGRCALFIKWLEDKCFEREL